jgi:hypothetical protein
MGIDGPKKTIGRNKRSRDASDATGSEPPIGLPMPQLLEMCTRIVLGKSTVPEQHGSRPELVINETQLVSELLQEESLCSLRMVSKGALRTLALPPSRRHMIEVNAKILRTIGAVVHRKQHKRVPHLVDDDDGIVDEWPRQAPVATQSVKPQELAHLGKDYPSLTKTNGVVFHEGVDDVVVRI